MISVIKELKAQARVLHRQAERLEPAALARLGLEPGSPDAGNIQRRHCLAAIARELGFSGWPHAVAVLSGADDSDFGTLLYPAGGSAHTNIWSASYDEAREIRAQVDGYLLAYKRHYFIVDRHFIEALGLDPDAPEWQVMGRDWVRPQQLDARERLYRRLIQARQRATPRPEARR